MQTSMVRGLGAPLAAPSARRGAACASEASSSRAAQRPPILRAFPRLVLRRPQQQLTVCSAGVAHPGEVSGRVGDPEPGSCGHLILAGLRVMQGASHATLLPSVLPPRALDDSWGLQPAAPRPWFLWHRTHT